MISSREAMSSVDQAISSARRDEDRLVAMLRSVTEDAARLRAQQLAGFKALARLKLDALAGTTIAIELESAEKRALQALDRRRDALAAADRERAELEAAVAAAEAARLEKDAAFEAAEDAVEELAVRTRARLAGEAAWQAEDAGVREAEAKAAAAETKAAQAEADRLEKGKPYEADPLFMYLWGRGFGTSAYRAGPLVRFFDGKVARLVGYDAARPNYHMLNEIPLRLREHAERLKAAVAEATARREALERAALVADGIEALEAAAEAAEAALEAAADAQEELEARLKAADEAKAVLLDESKDSGLQEAVGAIAESLARKDLTELYREAMRTPTEEDERIVNELRAVEGTLVRKDAEAEEVRKTAVDMGRRRTELERSRAAFRSAGYDDPYGQFSNESVLARVIGSVLAGALSGRDLEDAFRDGFSRRPRPSSGGFSGGFGGGFGGGSSRGGSSRGGGFRGGGFRSGGGFRGGGFRSGGKF